MVRVCACFLETGFLRSPKCPDQLWGSPAACSVGIWGSFPRGKAAGAWSLSHISIECRGFEWVELVSASPICFHGVLGDSFTFTLAVLPEVPTLFKLGFCYKVCSQHFAVKISAAIKDAVIVLPCVWFKRRCLVGRYCIWKYKRFYCRDLTMAVDGRRWQVYGLGLGTSEVSGFM